VLISLLQALSEPAAATDLAGAGKTTGSAHAALETLLEDPANYHEGRIGTVTLRIPKLATEEPPFRGPPEDRSAVIDRADLLLPPQIKTSPLMSLSGRVVQDGFLFISLSPQYRNDTRMRIDGLRAANIHFAQLKLTPDVSIWFNQTIPNFEFVYVEYHDILTPSGNTLTFECGSMRAGSSAPNRICKTDFYWRDTLASYQVNALDLPKISTIHKEIIHLLMQMSINMEQP
jgi:hypothetical protein